MKDKIFGVLQRVGRSFMLPIALLPVAGLLLGIGSSFTNETMLAAYGLNNVIHPGTLIYTILDVMSQTGNAVFSNLALLFAMGVAIGMARKEKEVAALSGAVAYIIMNTAIQAMINAAGGVEAMPANSTTTMLGITTLQMGVFGGIVVGLGVAALHNKFYKIELPQVLAFFGGTRFVPIVSSIVYLVVGIAMFYIWPVVQSGIAALGALVLASGYAGTFIYGLLERALIPFGLHHVFYMPFWQTAVGGTAIIDGVTVTGAQNIFFAELASKSTTVFSVSATRFMAGKFPFMMFGLPGAALAMYQCAKPEKKKVAGGLLLSAALGALVGLERSKRRKEAGIRTHCIIACTSALFMIVSKYAFLDCVTLDGLRGADPARIAAQVVSGISFLGAGVIFKNGNSIRGLTTAAGMWGTAAIGMAVGAGMYWLGLFEAAVLVAIQIILHRFPVGADALTTQELLVELEDTDELRARFDELLKEHRGQVTESSLTRQDGCLRMEITVRLEPPITHDEALAFMRENPGVKRMSV